MAKYIKRHIRFALLLSIVTILGSCIDELSYDIPPMEESINITGLLSDKLEKQSIVIRNVIGLTSESATIADPIENAKVHIIDSDGIAHELTYEGKAIYSVYMAAEEGKTYQLEVITDDGTKYVSNEVKMQKGAEIDSIQHTLVNNQVLNSNGSLTDNFEIEVSISSNLIADSAPINTIYRVSSVYQFMEDVIRISPPLRTCYITQYFDLSNLVVLSGNDLPDSQIFEKVLISTAYDHRFKFNFAFIVEQYAIDDATYNYWKKIESINSEKSSLFSPPPGRVESNIKCTTDSEKIAYGYFTVGAKSEKISLTNSTEIGKIVQDYCRSFGWNNKPPRCTDCLSVSNSTTTKPSFWP